MEKPLPGYTVHRYRPRVEGLFAVIERWTRDDGDVPHSRSLQAISSPARRARVSLRPSTAGNDAGVRRSAILKLGEVGGEKEIPAVADLLMRAQTREDMEAAEQALSALPYLPEQRETREQAIDLRLALRSALQPSGALGRIIEVLRRPEYAAGNA